MVSCSRFSEGPAKFLVATLAVSVILVWVAGCPLNNNNGNTNSNGNSNGNDNTPPETGNSGLTGKFIGSERCSVCHKNLHTDWAGTLHSRAYETLESIGQQSNPDCVGCHTVGYGEPGGWVDRATTNDLAGVGCEACHGGAAEHASNASDESLRPTINLSADVCGKCHTDTHHPNYDDWLMSKHADSIEDSQITDWAAGTPGRLTTCGKCHSGDYFFHAIIKGETVGDDFLAGKTSEEMTRITCAICHNPHAKTGKASTPEEGRDYQLRYDEIKFTTPTNTLEAATDPSRFNLCGQCHHARDRVWTDSSREPHPSDQANVFFGEMPLPEGKPEPLVASRPSVHLNAPDQCRTCHVYRKPFESDIAPTVSGHTFEPNFAGCATSGCHPTSEVAQAKFDGLTVELQIRTTSTLAALDAWSAQHGLNWEYTGGGGPDAAGQERIPDEIKKSRFLYYYVAAGGGGGVHNPDYVREALINAENFAKSAPAPAPEPAPAP